MSFREVFSAYSQEVMSFDLTGQGLKPAGPDSPGDPADFIDRVGRLLRSSGRDQVVLFGLGTGRLANALARRLDRGRLVVVELDPAASRRILGAAGADIQERQTVLTDTSIWAVYLLLLKYDLTPDRAVSFLNPESGQDEPGEARPLVELRRLWAGAKELSLQSGTRGRLSLAAILAPDEPALESFWQHLPGWLDEVVVVWDGRPGRLPEGPLKLVQTARPLANDFAAQRNQALKLCQGDWVLFLDADERLDEAAWATVRAFISQDDLTGLWWPRQTLYPDADHSLIGFGLWPDLQLRLFRRQAGLAFVNPVHERLTGLSGAAGVSLDSHILHLSRLLKTPAALRRKLEGFDRSAGLAGLHRLNSDYPHLARACLDNRPQAGRIF